MVTTVDFRSINFRTDPADRDAALERLANERAQALADTLKALDEYEPEILSTGGRPYRVLPQVIAVRVLADVTAGLSYREIERKYKRTQYAFSREWLRVAVDLGRLDRMAQGLLPVDLTNHGRKAA